ncbi:MAG: hypothetical protein AB1749_10405 [Pseudomonadota bacterium]
MTSAARLGGWWRVLSLMLLASVVGAVVELRAGAGQLPEGRRTITLVAVSGAELRIGHVDFKPAEGGATFTLDLDAPDFGDEFLSMRPFRCLPDRKEMWCHLPYPYETRRRIRAGDLVELEYALLFLFRPPGAYGIDAWNGLYFKLSLGADGRIAGRVHEVDLNVLAVPPDAPNARPLTHAALTPVPADAHRFASIKIE